MAGNDFEATFGTKSPGNGIANKLQDKLHDAVDHAGDTAGDLAKRAKDRVLTTLDQVSSLVEKRPFAAIGIALGLGFLIAKLRSR